MGSEQEQDPDQKDELDDRKQKLIQTARADAAEADDKARARRVIECVELYEMWKARTPRLTSIGRSEILGLMGEAFDKGRLLEQIQKEG
jgi:hypothetical protein